MALQAGAGPGSSSAGGGVVLSAGAIALAAFIAAPILAVALLSIAPGTQTWSHLASTVLPGYVGNTLALMAGVAVGVILLGVPSAWLVSMFRFPGSRLFDWALVVPLAMPAYVIAYAYTDLLQFSGPVQGALRTLSGRQAGEYWFPEVRSVGGAIAMFSLVLYPYVYLLARAAFVAQAANLLEAGRLLGRGAWGTFALVALPLARPGIAAGASLALMETLADFGTVSYFSVQTFTTGIFDAWLSLSDVAAAGQLAMVLLAFVALVLALERANRGRARYENVAARAVAARRELRGVHAIGAFLACAFPLLSGFLVPAAALALLAAEGSAVLLSTRFGELVRNSFSLAALTSIAAVAFALLLAYAARLSRSAWVARANRLAGLGYALPGAVIAVGILVPVSRFDNLLADWFKSAWGIELGLLVTGSVAALIYAYLVRFLAIALQALEAGLAKIHPGMEDAARSLGLAPGAVLARVHAPMLRGSLLSAALLVFVDVMKEIPATFMMRPFNFDTLAVQAYNYAADERLAEAGAASLVIVAVGLIPVIGLAVTMARKRQ
ncbi:MAG: iron ABC transporter permease [Betaproteobacteria bacterium]|nr:iron ABC transporter permease [Betaproteobacteria bacterium]